jgi:D-tyrosyl-tRNA(Tyr) deacylase
VASGLELDLIDLWGKSPENWFMKVVVQRVSQAEVAVGGQTVARIGNGILALVAISRRDTEKELHWMARKIVELRIFNDKEGKMNLSLKDVQGQLLIVSQFTLYGDCKKGRRPSYIDAASPAEAEKMYHEFVSGVRELVPEVQTGQFQAMMEVNLTNSGPVTLILEN